MESVFDKARIKVWFQGLSTSRNIDDVVKIIIKGDLVLITDANENNYFLNMRNINLMEEVIS